MANLAVFPDDSRASYHCAVLHHGAFANEHFFTDKGDPLTAVPQFAPNIFRDISAYPFQSVPGELATFEQLCMLGLVEVEQIVGLKHIAKVEQRRFSTEGKIDRIAARSNVPPIKDLSDFHCVATKSHFDMEWEARLFFG
jgi:hypothetical protein